VNIGGVGGVGLASSITGSSVFRGGGGGGGSNAVNFGHAAGGNGGGGDGGGSNGTGNWDLSGENGDTNTGGGGGGFHLGPGSTGGSGVVILRMSASSYSGTTTGSPTVDSSTVAGTTILTFNGDGSYTS
jgi:hypothetical protein